MLKVRVLELLKIILYFVIIFLLFYQVYLCFENYLAYPKYISTKVVDQRDTVFPDVTICPNDTTFKLDQFFHFFHERYNEARLDGIPSQRYRNATLSRAFKKTETRGWEGCFTFSRAERHQQLGIYYLRFYYRNAKVELYVHFSWSPLGEPANAQ
ncbi:uncharacterized protein LOC131893667 isoform X2 [Tigriopus californicus]|uniref:uncharacterized protein LOC131893667 isoform X2 n=1 Tax=Tigriopus californicus TaxID=6832 RepID=UPI0027DA5D82|nr:uncharacterized protein LOC131893667 isoform X2 [Tigriopus californicus]